MKKLFFPVCVALTFFSTINAQELYFPPNGSDEWETISVSEAGYNQWAVQPLLNFLTESDSKGFIILQKGKIVLEEYMNDFDGTKNWYWASAGKSLTSTIVGIAQQEGYLEIDDFTSKYLGESWTDCPEEEIKIVHQLSMTSGLDYSVENNGCTDPECLLCLNEAGSEWYYHNAPYTLLEEVVANAVNQSYNQYTKAAISDKIGMNGVWIKTGDNNVYYSTPRSMARFGLMALAEGKWNEETIINKNYFNQMINTSQDINPSYGYLWWLNGKDQFRLPSSTFTFNGSLIPNAPSDMYAALGKNSQVCMVIPSLDLVIIRMGNDPDESLVPLDFVINLWEKVEDLILTTSIDQIDLSTIKLTPNPISTGGKLTIDAPFNIKKVNIKTINGNLVKSYTNYNDLILPQLSAGFYLIEMIGESNSISKIIIVQ